MNIIYIVVIMSSYCKFSWKIWKPVLTFKLGFHFSHEFANDNFSQKEDISKLSSWWDNDLTHHISLHQPLCEPLLDENQYWWCVALIVWSWYPQCATWDFSAVEFRQKQYDTTASCIQMQYWWHLWMPSIPRMTGLKSDNVWSSRSTPPIHWL